MSVLEHDLNGHVAAETAGASRIESVPPRDRAQDTAKVLAIAIRVLAERAFPWVTLVLVSILWFCVTLMVELTPWKIVAAVLFTCLTHVPTWPCWRKGS